MGKVIKKKMNGMNWWMKTSIVLLLTLATTVLMYQGMYHPVPAQAAATPHTYYLVGDTTTALGADGTANLPTAQSTTNATSTTTPTFHGTLSTTVGTALSWRPASTSTGSIVMLNGYGPVYANDVDISAISVTMAVRSNSTAYSWHLDLYEYDPAGALDNKKLIATSSNVSNTTAGTVQGLAPTYTISGTGRISAGHRLMAQLVHTATTASTAERVYYGGNTATTGIIINLTETDVITDTTAPIPGTVTISPDISSAYTSAAPTISTVFTDAESAVTACEYTTDGTTWIAGVVSGAASPYTCTANPSGLTGFLNINMRATSTGGTGTATQIQRTVDTSVPTDGTLTVTRADSLNSLSWTAATDPGGSGIASYILIYATGATAPLCNAGTAVPGSPFTAATLSVSHTGLVNGTQYSYRLCAVDNIGNTSGGATGTGTPFAVLPSTINNCNGCHGYTSSFTDGSARNAAGAGAGTFQGSHTNHVISGGFVCSTCHVVPATETVADNNHSTGSVALLSNIRGGSYSRGTSVPVSNTFTPGACNATTCHGGVSPTWGTNTTSATCTKCHGVSGTTTAAYAADTKLAAPGYNGTGRATSGATVASDSKVGAHDTHLRGLNTIANPVACTECHSNVNTSSAAFTGHMDGTGTLSFGALATSGTGTAPSYNATSGTCSNTYCHFDKPHNALYAPAVTNAAVVWNNTAYLNGTVADCQKCHQSPPTTASGVHVGKAFPSSCNTCHNHVSPAGVITDATKHINGVVDASGGHSFPFPGASHLSLAGSTPWGDCSGCHNTSATGVTYTTWAANNRGTAPNCTTCHLNGLNTPDAVVKTSSCYDCHGASATDGMPNGSAFPNNAGSHTKHVVGQGLVCATCHNGGGNVTANHGNSNGVTRTIADITVASASGQFTFAWAGGPGVTPTCSSVACHGTAVWGVTTFDCVSCHSSLITITKGPLANGTNQRRAVASELTTSGSRNHKGTATGTAPTKWDCIVCHLEGDSATGSQASAYHGNGVLDFRDPDGTGNQPIKKVAWGGLPYAAGITDPGGRYIDTMTNFTTARFSRDLSLVLESDPAWLNVATIQMNLCLHCHDSNGAQNSTSWTKNAAGTVVGTAGQPFGLPVGNSSTQYWVTTTLMSAAGNTTGNVMNVFSQLSSANASSHPVTGRGNNGFAKGTQMKAPWSGGTNLPHASTTVYGYLISCFDCHGVLNSTGAQSSTVVAHGNGSTVTTAQLRAPYPTAALGGIAVSGSKNNLCTLCHADTYASTTNGHGPNSGITAGPASMTATTFGTCSNCHVTQTNNVGARAVAVHGYNATESASATFPTTNSRPYAFWRGGPQVLYWGPGSCSVSCTTQTYTTAGVY